MLDIPVDIPVETGIVCFNTMERFHERKVAQCYYVLRCRSSYVALICRIPHANVQVVSSRLPYVSFTHAFARGSLLSGLQENKR